MVFSVPEAAGPESGGVSSGAEAPLAAVVAASPSLLPPSVHRARTRTTTQGGPAVRGTVRAPSDTGAVGARPVTVSLSRRNHL